MKALLLDADGVIFKKGEYFSVRFAREYKAPESEVIAFFKGKFLACQRGEADLKEELTPLLPNWNWHEGVEAFLEYWFSSDVEINSLIEEFLAEYRALGIKLYLASGQERYRGEYIKEILNKKGILDGYFFSYEIGARKSESGFFEQVLADLKVEPSDIYYLDNDQRCIDQAKSVGIQSYLYSDEIMKTLLVELKNK